MSRKLDRAPIEDMILHAQRALRHVSGMTLEQLVGDELHSDAVLRALSIVGEASTRVSEESRLRFTDVPCKQIRGMRNVLIHQYDWFEWDKVYSTVSIDIPALLPVLLAIRSTLLAEEPPPPETPADDR